MPDSKPVTVVGPDPDAHAHAYRNALGGSVSVIHSHPHDPTFARGHSHPFDSPESQADPATHVDGGSDSDPI